MISCDGKLYPLKRTVLDGRGNYAFQISFGKHPTHRLKSGSFIWTLSVPELERFSHGNLSDVYHRPVFVLDGREYISFKDRMVNPISLVGVMFNL